MYLGMGMKVIETSLKLQNNIISNSAFYRQKNPFSLNIYLILRTLNQNSLHMLSITMKIYILSCIDTTSLKFMRNVDEKVKRSCSKKKMIQPILKIYLFYRIQCDLHEYHYETGTSGTVIFLVN